MCRGRQPDLTVADRNLEIAAHIQSGHSWAYIMEKMGVKKWQVMYAASVYQLTSIYRRQPRKKIKVEKPVKTREKKPRPTPSNAQPERNQQIWARFSEGVAVREIV